MAETLKNPFYDEQIQLIRLSWQTVSRVKRKVGMMSLEKMVYRSPRLRNLFSEDLKRSSAKLIIMLEATVHNLDEWDNVVYLIRSMAEEYYQYGLEVKDLRKWERSVLWGIYKAMGNEWSDILRQTWEEVLAQIRKEMEQHIKKYKKYNE